MEQRALNGKVALVTGAGSGLGEATARAFADAGCAVACLDLNQDAAQRVACDLERQGEKTLAFGCDVSDAESVSRSVAAVLTRLTRIDIAVNCAAVDYTYWVDELTVDQWDREIAVNLRGPFLVAKAVMPGMRDQGGGHIVNVASTAAVRAWTGASAYHASKWGILGFSRGLGAEGRRDNIRVTTVIPGGMQTHFFDRFVEQGIPMPDPANLQSPANVARSIVFAVSLPPDSVMQELIITPMNEPSWP
ncbi:MAG TPA: SDR family oxidoreductase [Thermomicrobiales bacterium]|nr:SDR family oxidoreductase [Thermomicrobiales bacterium]